VLFYFKYKKFSHSDPAPELIYLNTFRQSHSVVGVAEVKTGLFIKSFSVFDLAKNHFKMDAIVWFKFKPTLISLEIIEQFSFEQGNIIEKSLPRIKVEDDYLLVRYDVQVQFSTNLDFHSFPFESHRLHIVLVNENITPSELVFNISQSAFSWTNNLHTNDWRIIAKAAHSGYGEALFDRADPNKKTAHPKIIFTLDLAQKGLRKAILIFLPVLLIIFMSNFALSMNPERMDVAMLELGAVSLTGVLFYRFVIENITPDVGYSTLVDYFFNVALACNGITFILIVLRINLYNLLTVTYEGYVWFYTLQIVMIVYICYLLYQPQLGRVVSQRKEKGGVKKDRFYKTLVNLFNLTTLQKYVLHKNEFPAIDNSNWLNPDYSSFCKRITEKWYIHIWWKLTYKFQNSFFFSLLFKDILQELVMQRESLMTGDFVVKLNPGSNAKIIIWGDLHGALHSLIRDLTLLQQQGVLDNSLKIIKPDHYFIFNGNVVDRSPYILETLTIILRLMQLNPDTVFFVKGYHENNDQWRDNQTDNELKIKMGHIYKKNQLDHYLTRFFNTLPLAIYVKSANPKTQELMRIAHYGYNNLFWDESSLEYFLSSNDIEKIRVSPTQKILGQKNFIKLDVIIGSRIHQVNYRTTEGLELLESEQGATTWSILSSPTNTFGNLYGFYYDAFVVLDLQNSFLESTLNLYRQDVRQLSHFTRKTFHPIYGFGLPESGLVPFKAQNQITLGCSLDLSKTVVVLGKRLHEGIRLGISHQNTLGGIRGAPLRLITLDDNYTPHITFTNAQFLLNIYHTNILLSPLGSPTTETLLPLIRAKKMLVLFPYSGADNLRSPDLEHLIHFRTSYTNEADALTTYAVEKLAMKRFAIFYQNDSLGLGPLESTRKKLMQYSIDDWLEVPYQRNDSNVDLAAQKIREFNPAVILFFSTNVPSVELVHKLGINKIAGKVLIGISILTDIFRDFLHGAGLELIISRVVPNILSKDIPIVADYLSLISNEHIDRTPSVDSLEGYINARILVRVLEMLDPPFTKEKIIAKFEEMKEFDVGGLILNFDPMTRELFKKVWIDTGSKEWISS